MPAAAPLAVCLALMLLAFFGIALVDRHALPAVLGTAALLFVAVGFVAALFAL